ncbi:MAG: carboxylesterase family protein [Eubacterium sp.]|nr:carboxylesterase family protein [Eubacterium sp.]
MLKMALVLTATAVIGTTASGIVGGTAFSENGRGFGFGDAFSDDAILTDDGKYLTDLSGSDGSGDVIIEIPSETAEPDADEVETTSVERPINEEKGDVGVESPGAETTSVESPDIESPDVETVNGEDVKEDIPQVDSPSKEEGVVDDKKNDDDIYEEFPTKEEIRTGVVVKTKYGYMRGIKSRKGICWNSVPYGKAKRWCKPTEPDSWNGVKRFVKNKNTKGNDSLYMNITRPKGHSQKMPVMVYVHGGGNTKGTANYNFRDVAKETQTIVISIDYRKGAFGWFVSRGLSHAGADNLSGNYTLLDIKRALLWVKENVAVFGGDPDNVTISGFSAGARDVLNCVISPKMKGLFSKAVSFSGGMTTCSKKQGRKWSNEKLAKILVRRGTCSNMKKARKKIKKMSSAKLGRFLKGLSDKEVKKMAGSSSLSLQKFPQCFRDGKVIPKSGFNCVEFGRYNRVPIIIGSTSSESGANVYKKLKKLKKRGKIKVRGKKFKRLLVAAKKYGSMFQSSFYIEKVASTFQKDEYHEPIYVYRYKWGEKSDVVGKTYAKYIGSVHGMDVDCLLGRNVKGYGFRIYSNKNLPGREKLTYRMRQYFKNFFEAGNPNGIDNNGYTLYDWTQWTNKKKSARIMHFTANSENAMTWMSRQYIDRKRLFRSFKKNLSKTQYKILRSKVLKDKFYY